VLHECIFDAVPFEKNAAGDGKKAKADQLG
jgi:hypothetical protein